MCLFINDLSVILSNPYEIGTVSPILQMKNTGIREVNLLYSSQGRSLDWTQNS